MGRSFVRKWKERVRRGCKIVVSGTNKMGRKERVCRRGKIGRGKKEMELRWRKLMVEKGRGN